MTFQRAWLCIVGVVLLGPRLSASGPQGRDQVQRVDIGSGVAVRVLDARGQTVGIAVGQNTISGIFGGVPFLLEASKAGISNTASYALFYVTMDCGGQPYGPPDSGNLFADHLVVDNRIYYVSGAASPSVAYSRRSFDQFGPGPCESLGFFGLPGVFPYSIVPLDFAPPFRVAP